MDFKEAFEHYRKGIATQEETGCVEEELERYRLITDYLEDDFRDNIGSDESPAEELKRVRKAIRRRGRNIVIVTLAIIIVLALVYGLAGVPLLNSVYYNPTTHEYSPYSYDFDISMAAYAELFSAGFYHNGAIIENTGIGRYDMTVIRYNYMSGEEEFLSATLDRNKLSAPYTLTAGHLPVNVFARASYPVYSLGPETIKATDKRLSELPDYMSVIAYVSFTEDMGMGELSDFMSRSPVNCLWAGIRNAPEHTQLLPLCGMDLTGAGAIYENVSETYPSFELNLNSGKDLTAADYENHFKSLLRFLIDHPRFLDALDTDTDYEAYCRSVLDYVTNNGIKAYGVMVRGTAADILALKDSGVVSQVWPAKADIQF